MTHSRLHNKFPEYKILGIWTCVAVFRKGKENYFDNVNVRNITDNKQFWKTAKPFLSNKVGDNKITTLIKEDKVVSEERDVWNIKVILWGSSGKFRYW